MNFPIGLITDSLRLPFRDAVVKAAELGVQGVQVYAVRGEFTADSLPDTKKSDYRALLSSCGLKVSALCGDLGGHGFQIAEDNPARIKQTKKIMNLALDFNCNIVTTHIGAIPSDTSCDKYKIMQEACNILGRYAEDADSYFAIETGPESPERLKAFLDSLGTKGIAVNYDPANLAMVTASDPVKGVYTLKDYIVHTHAKDGVNLKPCDAEKIYGVFAGDTDPGEPIIVDEYFKEVPLGEGSVDFAAWTKALTDIGYKGFLTIEREVGDNPEEDIRKAVKFLRSL